MADGLLTVDIERDMIDRRPYITEQTGASPVAAQQRQRPNTAANLKPKKQTSAGNKYKRKPEIDLRLHSEFGISLGNKLFKNEKFERKITDIQQQIEELKGQRERGEHMFSEPASPTKFSYKLGGQAIPEGKVDAFYNEMNKFYEKPPKHESPTRRLRQQINCAFEQKALLSQQPEFRGDKQNYGICYVVGVSKTYVVQPEKGELPYEIAEKNPVKFYNEVMNGKVKEHKICKSPRRRRP